MAPTPTQETGGSGGAAVLVAADRHHAGGQNRGAAVAVGDETTSGQYKDAKRDMAGRQAVEQEAGHLGNNVMVDNSAEQTGEVLNVAGWRSCRTEMKTASDLGRLREAHDAWMA